MGTTISDPLELGRLLHDRLKAVFGGRLRGIVLYGSRARGDAQPDSDFDFLVLLDTVHTPSVEIERICQVTAELSLERDIVVSALPASEAAFAESGLPFYRNARREGVVMFGPLAAGEETSRLSDRSPRGRADGVSPDARFLLDKGKRSVEAASFLLSGGYPEEAASRAYYAAFHAAEAFLVERDLSFSSHPAVIEAFGRRARESGLPDELHRTFLDAFQARNAADHGGEADPTPLEAERLIGRVSGLVEAIELDLREDAGE